MRDLGNELVQAALDKGLITPEEQAKVESLVKKSRGRAYAAQVMVRERMISCSDLLTLQNNLKASLYACPACEKRFPRDSLPKRDGKTFRCPACKKKVVLDQPVLSRLEVLTSRDPLDLTITLGEVETDISSEVSAIDLNRYEVNEELGRGGYGVVFKAFHRDLERDVALKVLRPSKDLPRITLERFIREGRSASRLKHPNVVGVYDIGRSRDLYALAMEFVPGKSLKEHIKARKRLPWPLALELMDGILAGVEHAHEKGIIHRDLKPTNIIIEKGTGRPRIIDFGLAKDLKSDVNLTAAGAIVGTPYYLSPEQIEGRSRKVDGRSDVFALGVILYFMIAGKRPFDSKLKAEIYTQILHDHPEPLSELLEDVPPELDDLLAKAMAKKRTDRFADVTAFRLALAELAETAGTSEERAARKKKSGKRRRTDRRPRPGARAGGGSNNAPKIAAAVLGGLLILVLGFVAASGGGSGDVANTGVDDPPQETPAVDPDRDSDETPPKEPNRDPPEGPTGEPEQGSAVPEREHEEPGHTTEPEPAEPTTPVEPPVEPLPEPAPDPLPTGEPNPEGDAAEPTPAEPTPAEPTPAEPAKPVQLDDGRGDAKEFPTLAERSQREWLKRAFFLNDVAESPPSPHNVRALRFGLSDRFPLNNAFALRGLNRYDDGEFLKAYGSKALFEALVDLSKSREPYVQNTSQSLLVRMCGGEARSASAWKKWWREEGEQAFGDAARNPPDVQIPEGQEKADTEHVETRTRKVTQYFSKLRKGGLDILFVIDVTLSMTDELDRMRAQVNEITSFMELLLKGKVRMGFVTYGDQVVKSVPLTKKLGNFAREVEEIAIFNDPNDRTIEEGISAGLTEALTKKMGWRSKAQRTILLLGDAPPLDAQKCRDLAKAAGENAFTINGLIAKPPAKYSHKDPKPTFEEVAAATGGLTAELNSPEELITRILVFAFGSNQEADLRRFVVAYREVTGAANQGPK